MDMTMKATRIGLGVESGRKLVGLKWFTPGGNAAHRTLTCNHIDPVEAVRYPVFIEDGQMRAEAEENFDVTDCSFCPEPTQEGWQEWANCQDTDGAFAETKAERAKFIEKYCNTCAVQLECLDYGASLGQANAGAVWGGIYFVNNATNRRRNIAEQRDKIESGVFG